MMKETILSSPSVGEEFRASVDRLRMSGVTNAEWEARELMAAVLKESPPLVPLRFRESLDPAQRAVWQRLVSDRCARKPLAQVLGEWSFSGMRLSITPEVLVPRPETEEFFAWVSARMPERPFSLADIGTGSGCLAIAMARRYRNAYVWAVDASPSALAVARRNAEAQGVSARVFFLEGDLMVRLPTALHLDAVVANLPYVDERDMESLSPEVRNEPALALNGGRGGLDVIRRLVIQAWERLPAEGRLFLEIGHDQAAAVTTLFKGMGYRASETGKDFAGVERFVMGVK